MKVKSVQEKCKVKKLIPAWVLQNMDSDFADCIFPAHFQPACCVVLDRVCSLEVVKDKGVTKRAFPQ